MLQQLDLVSCSVLGDLPLYEAMVSPGAKIRDVTEWLERVPDLPGVIIKEEKQGFLLPRERLHKWLSKPFGNELFLNRPISFLNLSTILKSLILPADTRIDEAVRIVLERPAMEIYDPIIVALGEERMKILDFHVLLLAQTQLLAQANHFVSQQVESGRVLSQIMELPDLFSQILTYLAGLIDIDQATIFVVDSEMMGSLSPSQYVKKSAGHHSIEILNDPKVIQYLIHSRQPLLITNVENAGEWFNPQPYAGVLSWIGFPLIYSGKVICLLSLTRLIQPNSPGAFSRSDIDLLVSLSGTFTAAIRNAHLHSELRMLAVTDPLTGVMNRRGFFEVAQKLFDWPLSSTLPCSALILDIDYFKRVNDTFGHQVGDLVIRSVAAECKRQLRDADVLGRYGGEEFIVFLPGADLIVAHGVAERLRNAVAHLSIETGMGATSISVSVGVATRHQGSLLLEGLIQQADAAMYLAKSLGRNRTEVWEDVSRLDVPVGQPAVGWSGSAHNAPLEFGLSQKLHTHSLEAVETESILGWVKAMELRENGEEHHAQLAADCMIRLCRRLGFKEADLVHIYRGAMLHDVGKLAVPDQIHNKPGPLDQQEWEIMRKHVDLGFQMLTPVSFLSPALAIPLCHHEKWDGNGYPRGLIGAEIPLEARLFALVDVWQALLANRCYRAAWSEDGVVDYIRSQAGKHFDPDLIEIFLETIRTPNVP